MQSADCSFVSLLEQGLAGIKEQQAMRFRLYGTISESYSRWWCRQGADSATKCLSCHFITRKLQNKYVSLGRSSDLFPDSGAFPPVNGSDVMPSRLVKLTAAGLFRILTWFPFHSLWLHQNLAAKLAKFSNPAKFICNVYHHWDVCQTVTAYDSLTLRRKRHPAICHNSNGWSSGYEGQNQLFMQECEEDEIGVVTSYPQTGPSRVSRRNFPDIFNPFNQSDSFEKV